MNRTEAARIGGMDRQTLRDLVHRFNELFDRAERGFRLHLDVALDELV
jgi:hypothetical protein